MEDGGMREERRGTREIRVSKEQDIRELSELANWCGLGVAFF
jgi:hypothetical protein